MSDKLIWKIEKRKVSELIEWVRNPRFITKENFERLIARIIKRGMHDILKIDIDGTVLSGNQRKKALEFLGIREVYVLVPNRKLTEREREQVAIESNMNDGEWNFDELANFDEKILMDLGWDSSSLDQIFNLDLGDDDWDADAEIKKIKKPNVRTGDLYLLGGKVVCPKCKKETEI